MTEDNIFNRFRKGLPEGFWRFLIIGFIIYSFIVVGKVIFENWGQNKTIEDQKKEIANLKEEITSMELNIAYYKTNTYKEKIARAKLRYALPGENVVAVPYDQTVEQKTKQESSSTIISRPNYEYWKMYFFGQ